MEHPQVRFLREIGRPDLIESWEKRWHRRRLMILMLIGCCLLILLFTTLGRHALANHPVWGNHAWLIQVFVYAVLGMLIIMEVVGYMFFSDAKEKDLRKVLRDYPNRFDIE